MDAFHSFWSKPNKLKHNGAVRLPDYEQLTAIISALKWREHNGNIYMFTDTEGAAYLQEIGLHSFWNRIDTGLDALPQDTDPFLFWAAGKLEALRHMPSPCVMLDTDLIVWENIDDVVGQYDVTAAHSESLNPDVYPEPGAMRFEGRYSFPDSWDFTVDAANTAFLCIRDEEFKEHYITEAFDFASHVRRDGLDPVKAMCFAEQRILPMCAKEYDRSIGYLIELQKAEEQELVTHTWGFKQALWCLPEARHSFCLRCARRIASDFPESFEQLGKCPDLRPYYEELINL